MKSEIILLLGGKTGGPIIPLLAYINVFKKYTFEICGVAHSFEEKYCEENGMRLHTFPEAKLRLISFSNHSLVSFLLNSIDAIMSFFLLLYAFAKAVITLIRIKPRAIISAGSFLAVPIIPASKFCNLFFGIDTKIIIHQQDPEPGMAHKITHRFADITTVTFESTRNYPGFSDAEIIPNPFDFQRYNEINIKKLNEKTRVYDPEMYSLINKKSKKSLLLIFGGGSGSEFINSWVYNNIDALTKTFRILHLTGVLRDESDVASRSDYHSVKFLTDLMPYALVHCDLVLSRSGLSSITDYINLKKKAYLVPIPSSHQEKNAKEVSGYFHILHQSDVDNWFNTIVSTYPQYSTSTFPSSKQTQKKLLRYYSRLQELLS